MQVVAVEASPVIRILLSCNRPALAEAMVTTLCLALTDKLQWRFGWKALAVGPEAACKLAII